MNRHTDSTLRTRQPIVTATLALLVALACSYAWPAAQSQARKALTVEDYTKWRGITGAEISGDGKWVTYVLQLTNTAPTETKPVLHLLKLDTNEDTSVPNATGGTFSADSHWIAYQVDPNPGRGGRGGRGVAGTGTPPADADVPPADPSVPPGAPAPPVNPAQPPAAPAPAAPAV